MKLCLTLYVYWYLIRCIAYVLILRKEKQNYILGIVPIVGSILVYIRLCGSDKARAFLYALMSEYILFPLYYLFIDLWIIFSTGLPPMTVSLIVDIITSLIMVIYLTYEDYYIAKRTSNIYRTNKIVFWILVLWQKLGFIIIGVSKYSKHILRKKYEREEV